MRLYVFLDKDMIKSIAPKIGDISFDIDFFEYTEKRGYTTNNNTSIRPEFENDIRKECKEVNGSNRKRIGFSEDNGRLCNVEITKRFINIEDVTTIKNNNFYYNIIEKVNEDNRIKKVTGRITTLEKTHFYMNDVKFIISEEAYNSLNELYENACEINCLVYKINCLNSDVDVFKVIAIYIE